MMAAITPPWAMMQVSSLISENAYWAFYIGDDYAQTGVDSTSITAGASYKMVKTVSYTVKGEGATVFYFTVRNVDKTVTRFEIHTDKTIVGEALLELGLIEVAYSPIKYAALNEDAEALSKITELEQLLSKKTGKDIALVALSF